MEEKTYHVYAWGRNKNGELTFGNAKKQIIPKGVRGLNKKVLYISSGTEHTAVITYDGQMLVCGSSLHGKLGIEDLGVPNCGKFIPFPNLPQGSIVRQVACGDYHTMCLLDTGVVWAWGGTLHKKLGQREGRPAMIVSLKNIVAIDCGDFHSAALNSSGDLYTWGGGGRDYNKGQLGHGHLNDVEHPEKVKLAQKVRHFSCGGYHMMAVDESNQLWSWGSGQSGETGLGDFGDTNLPRKVYVSWNQKSYIVSDIYIADQEPQVSIVDIKLGGHHSVLLTNQGLVYTCGFAQHGQLGIKSLENQNKFQLVVGLTDHKVIQISAGWNHTVVMTNARDIYTCGYNQAGQLGLGDDQTRTTFTHVTKIAGKNITQIIAGGNHTWALVDYNEPLIHDYQFPSPIKDEPVFQQVSNTSNIDSLSDKFVEVIVSEVDNCHRFIRLKGSLEQRQSMQAKIGDYMGLMQKDKYLKLIKMQSDSDALGIENPQNSSFTIMMVSQMSETRDNIEYQKGSSTPIGQKYLVKVKGLKSSNWSWVSFAEKLLGPYDPSYLELRKTI